MARKKILPKKLGPVKIPKNVRKRADQALADPKVVAIVSGALASVGALIAAPKVAYEVPGGAALASSVAGNETVASVGDVVKQAFNDILHLRYQPQEERSEHVGDRRRNKAKAGAAGSKKTAEPGSDRRH
jgi:hypothetical protein